MDHEREAVALDPDPSIERVREQARREVEAARLRVASDWPAIELDPRKWRELENRLDNLR